KAFGAAECRNANADGDHARARASAAVTGSRAKPKLRAWARNMSKSAHDVPQGEGVSDTSCVKQIIHARRRAALFSRHWAPTKPKPNIGNARNCARSTRPAFKPGNTPRAVR